MKNEASEQKQKSRSRLYFALGYALLVIMALTWALGNAFNYIFMGAAAFFLYLGFRQYHHSSPSTSGWRHAQPSYQQSNIFDRISDFITRLKNNRNVRVSVSSPRGVPGVAVIFGVFIIIVAVMIVFSTSGEDDYTADMWTSQGSSFYNQQMYDSALLSYRKALSVNPGSEEALTGMGNVKLAQQEYDSAVKYFDLVLVNGITSDDALYGKGLAFYYLKNYDASLSALREILDVDPSHVDALLLTGDCNYAMNEYDAAIEHYEAAYALGARSFELSNVMGYIYDAQQKYDRALTSYQEALQYDDSNAEIKRRVQELSSSSVPAP